MKCLNCDNDSGKELLCAKCREEHNAKLGLPLSYTPAKIDDKKINVNSSNVPKKPYSWVYGLAAATIITFLLGSYIFHAFHVIGIILGVILGICVLVVIIRTAQDVDEIKQILLCPDKAEQEPER